MTLAGSMTGWSSVVRARFGAWARAIGAQLGVGQDGGDLPAAAAVEQLLAARRSYPATFTATIVAATSILVMLPSTDHFRSVLAAWFGLCLISGWNLRAWRRDMRDPARFAPERHAARRLAAMSFCTAVLWGLFLALCISGSAREWQLVITCVIVGVTCVGALSVATVPIASVGFLAGSLVMISVDLLVLREAPAGTLVFVAIFFVMLARSILTQTRLFIGTTRQATALVAASRKEAALIEAREAERARTRQIEIAARETAAATRQSLVTGLAARLDATIGDALATLAEAADATRGSATSLAAVSVANAEDADATAARALVALGAAESMSDTAAALARATETIERDVSRQARLTAAVETQVRDGEAAIDLLVAHAQDIGRIVALIDDVARQTAMLAMNATIEAARAGEAGRGFAIVANEVKTLSSQTHRATDDIGHEIAGIQARVDAAAAAIREITVHSREVAAIAGSISGAMTAQRVATGAIRSEAANVTHGADRLRADAEDGCAAAIRSRDLTAAVADATAGIVTRVGALATTTQGLLAELRAA